jgi:hypothetical protein
MERSTRAALDSEWVYTAALHQNIEVGWDGDAEVVVVDVEYEAATKTYWTGLTHYRTPNDHWFVPRWAWSRLEDAKWDADRWAREMAVDARWIAGGRR